MLLHKRILLDNLRRAELFFNTVHKLGSSESNTICNPSIHLLHSKLIRIFVVYYRKLGQRNNIAWRGRGVGGKLKFSLLKAAERHKGPLRQSFSDT